MGDKQKTSLPSIAGDDGVTRGVADTTLEKKSRNNYAASYLVGWIRELGYKRAAVRSDNSPSSLALLREVLAALPEIELVME